MTTNTEYLDLVTADDEIQTTLPRDEIYAQGLQYVRVIDAFIKNSEGKLWIPVRGQHKRIAPGGYDVGVGGHVEHGETYDEAFKKEVSEEIFWDISKLEYECLGKFGPKDGLDTISMIYEIKSDIAPELNPEDFTGAAWLTPQELADSIAAGHPAKTNILPLLRLVYDIKITV